MVSESEANKKQSIFDPVYAYERKAEERRYELGQTIGRNNFFMVFQGIVVAGAIQSLPERSASSVVIAILGIALSALQILMAASGRRLILKAEREAAEMERRLAMLHPDLEPAGYFDVGMPEPFKQHLEKLRAHEPKIRTLAEVLNFTEPRCDCDRWRHPIKWVMVKKPPAPSLVAIWVGIVLLIYWVAVLVLKF